jgi:hypothetical protein
MAIIITKLPGPTTVTMPATARELVLVTVPANTRAIEVQGFEDNGILPADCFIDTEGTDGAQMSEHAWTITGDRHYRLSDVIDGRRRTNAGAPFSFFIASAVPNGKVQLFLIKG